MTPDILQEVAEHEIPSLLQEFKDFHKYFLMQQYLKIMLEFKKANVAVPKQTLFRYGCVKEGVYILQSNFPGVAAPKLLVYTSNAREVAFEEVPFTSYFTFTASQDLAALKKVLMETKRIPWEKGGIYFEVTLDRFRPVFQQVAEEKKITFIWKHNIMMWLPPADPLDVGEVPEEMYLSYLSESHATEINNNWSHSFPGSAIYLGQQITSNFGLGLFRKIDGQMACSTLTFHSGGIFVLFTHPEFRGKGYAELVVRKTCQELREKERIPFAGILPHNLASQKLFHKCGFQHLTDIFFLQLI